MGDDEGAVDIVGKVEIEEGAGVFVIEARDNVYVVTLSSDFIRRLLTAVGRKTGSCTTTTDAGNGLIMPGDAGAAFFDRKFFLGRTVDADGGKAGGAAPSPDPSL